TRYNPREVTVAGHADKSGASDYNIALSERRAQAVSKVLTERGVANRVITQEAYGEAQPAVDTPDGVKLRENRRVVVEFLK
ncbi:MAG: OmpA family protein, partial [Alphaproteobacteria bacterium]|nr:OmpA family protein [Alphaproteobacteria bacterium]